MTLHKKLSINDAGGIIPYLDVEAVVVKHKGKSMADFLEIVLDDQLTDNERVRLINRVFNKSARNTGKRWLALFHEGDYLITNAQSATTKANKETNND